MTIEKQKLDNINKKREQYSVKIMQTRVEREAYTRDYLASKAEPNADEFLNKVCNDMKISPLPKTLIEKVLVIQKALGFEQRDDSRGQDGKLGPYTFDRISLKLNYKDKREIIYKNELQSRNKTKKEMELPESIKPSASSSLSISSAKEKGPINYQANQVVLIGDSHTKMYGIHMKINKAKNFKRIYKVGAGTRWMVKNLKRRISNGGLDGAKIAVVCGGANSITTSKSIQYNNLRIEQDPIIKDLIKMREMLAVHEPPVKTKFMTIPPMGRWIDKNRLGRLAKNACKIRVKRINNWIKQQNGSIDLDPILIPNGGDSMSRKTSSDGLHFRMSAPAKRVAGKIINSIQGDVLA